MHYILLYQLQVCGYVEEENVTTISIKMYLYSSSIKSLFSEEKLTKNKIMQKTFTITIISKCL